MSPFTRLPVLTSILTLIVVVCSLEELTAQELQTYELDEFPLENEIVTPDGAEIYLSYSPFGNRNLGTFGKV